MRCIICDYTPEDGSALRDVAPSHRIDIQGDICSDCRSSIDDNLEAITPLDDTYDQDVEELACLLKSQEEDIDEEFLGEEISGC